MLHVFMVASIATDALDILVIIVVPESTGLLAAGNDSLVIITA
jgi:hypothetical protein